MKHTPGPWIAMLKPFGGFMITPLKGGGRREIESVLFRHDKTDIVSEVDANARLIAAAPEMFECVASFVRKFGVAVECDEEISGADAVDWIGENMREFKNALSKARGLR